MPLLSVSDGVIIPAIGHGSISTPAFRDVIHLSKEVVTYVCNNRLDVFCKTNESSLCKVGRGVKSRGPSRFHVCRPQKSYAVRLSPNNSQAGWPHIFR